MEVDSNAPNGTQESRRKSGRVVRRPEIFSQEHHEGSLPTNGTSKRKRPAEATDADGDEEDDEEESEDDEDESEDEPDEEELKAQRRAQRTNAAAAKPASKRAKTIGGSSTTLAMRPANTTRTAGGKAAKTQKARARPSQAHLQGLYAEVFGRGQSAEDAASTWFQSVQSDSVAGIRDLINFVLQCIGCDSKIESEDVEDLDSVPTKLGDILQEYEQQKSPDYPLISKQKQYAGFQTVLEDFFNAVIKALHASSVFYDQPEVYDNIHVWIATMSGANYKSFRHTATIISLSMSTALCEVAKELQETMATLKAQMDAEKKKRSVNKARLKTIENNQKDAERRLEAIDAQLRDAFDTVYVHRYRDVEERIRAPCVAALGNWIVLYRKMFLEGQFLRYLGWVLNDTSSPTRLEDVRQLKNLFKNKKNVAALRAFTDRFRPRLVEMGARDADVTVRVEAIELLDRLRDAELLEPDDIDTIGRLIFDSEPRVRKAVAKFFVSNIEDLYGASVEDFDEAQYHAALPDKDEVDEYTVPTQSWIKFKCLGSILAGYDNDEESIDGTAGRSLPTDLSIDSRYTLATHSMYPYMRELHQWESLAGYLLYDHSSIPAAGDDEDINVQVQQAYQLNPGEDIILLDVLHASVKQYLQSILEPPTNRRTNATKDQIRAKQEAAAQNLTQILPDLLSKFGSTPQAASSILRIEQLLDIGLINDLQSGEATYSAILDDISKQFTSHSDKKVLAAASVAFRNARSYEQSKEAVDSKVQEIWTESITTITDLLRGKDVEKRGTLDKSSLAALVNSTTRLSELAGVCDCTQLLESRLGPAASRKQKGRAEQGTLLSLLLQLLKRGEPDEDTTDAFSELEDQLCAALIELLSRYFRWKMVGLKKAISSNDAGQLSIRNLTSLAMTRTTFVENLAPVISLRMPLDSVRYSAILNVLELFALFTTTRNMRPDKGALDEDVEQNLNSLITTVPGDIVKEVMVTHERLEKSFARKTHRKIVSSSEKKKGAAATDEDEEDIEKPPEDSEDENEDSDVDDEDEEPAGSGAGGKNAKKQAALLAEQNLCELTSKIIFAIVGGAVKDERVKKRVLLNRNKLGKNYAALVAYLDEKKQKQSGSGAKAKGKKPSEASKAAKEKKAAVSEEMVLEDDDIEDNERDEEEEQRQRDLAEDDIEDHHGGENEAEGDNGHGEGDEAEDDDIMGD
ncbi:cohesin complex subunit [Exophiala xenobiotica]|nr:cohesin complex subunit [Exophiala xenobiotica]